MLLDTLNLLKPTLFCYIQMQSLTPSNQALQLCLQNRGLWSIKQRKTFNGHRKLTTNMKSLQKAVAIRWSSDEGSSRLASAKFRSILTSVFSITKVDCAHSSCVCIFKKKWGEGTENRYIQRLEKKYSVVRNLKLIWLTSQKTKGWLEFSDSVPSEVRNTGF